MIKFVSFDSSKFSLEFVDDKFISFVLIIVVENERVSEVYGARWEVRNRENVLDRISYIGRGIFAKGNSRFL